MRRTALLRLGKKRLRVIERLGALTQLSLDPLDLLAQRNVRIGILTGRIQSDGCLIQLRGKGFFFLLKDSPVGSHGGGCLFGLLLFKLQRLRAGIALGAKFGNELISRIHAFLKSGDGFFQLGCFGL